ncbi:MAG: hypothetical protein HQL73_11200 [Magnetococcales bacterium]|nr:hypothetical protein [Magnetococcales bacterium]
MTPEKGDPLGIPPTQGHFPALAESKRMVMGIADLVYGGTMWVPDERLSDRADVSGRMFRQGPALFLIKAGYGLHETGLANGHILEVDRFCFNCGLIKESQNDSGNTYGDSNHGYS